MAVDRTGAPAAFHPPLQGEGRTAGPGWGARAGSIRNVPALGPHPAGFAVDPPPAEEGKGLCP
jgi:hypothetical protein